LKNIFANITDGYYYRLSAVQEEASANSSVTFAWAKIYFLASLLLDRDTFENFVLNSLCGRSFEVDENGFQFFCYNNLTNEIDQDLLYFENETNILYRVNNDNLLYLNNETEILNHNIGKESFPQMSNERRKLSISLIQSLKHLQTKIVDSILLSSTLTCSFITLHQSNFTVQWKETTRLERILVTIDVAGTKQTISSMSDIFYLQLDQTGDLRVCVHILNTFVKKPKKNRWKQSDLAINILTYTCMSASELCLVITLITYLGFHELRTVPGINNIFLSLSLILAQTVLVLASNIEGPSVMCTCIGIVTHFLWLWHFTWSFLCSLHMYRVFSTKIPSHPWKHNSACIYALQMMSLSLIVPVLIVAVVITSSYLKSQTIGYGHRFCYLDSAFLIGVSMVSLICLVSLCNLTFLSLTIASIHIVNRLVAFDAMKKAQYKNLILYVKLSSVTGVFWIVTIVAEAVDSDVL
ncbi:adhesion G protein-coupled receptor E3, partial [Biomphalaria glabrata]